MGRCDGIASIVCKANKVTWPANAGIVCMANTASIASNAVRKATLALSAWTTREHRQHCGQEGNAGIVCNCIANKVTSPAMRAEVNAYIAGVARCLSTDDSTASSYEFGRR